MGDCWLVRRIPMVCHACMCIKRVAYCHDVAKQLSGYRRDRLYICRAILMRCLLTVKFCQVISPNNTCSGHQALHSKKKNNQMQRPHLCWRGSFESRAADSSRPMAPSARNASMAASLCRVRHDSASSALRLHTIIYEYNKRKEKHEERW